MKQTRLFAFIALIGILSGRQASGQLQIVHIAGNNTTTHTGDDTFAHMASLRAPTSICFDDSSNLYIADGGPFYYMNDACIRRVNATTGIITTIAGVRYQADSAYNLQDSIQATAAKLRGCTSICLDKDGNILLADGHSRIQKVNLQTGIITVVAGQLDITGYSGDGHLAKDALLNGPVDVAVDGAGNIYIADMNNHAIRRINAVTGVITTVAGTGHPGYSGNGGLAGSAKLNAPHGVYVDVSNNIYIADYNNNRIRVVSPSGIISTFAGSGPGFGGDGGPKEAALLSQPVRVTGDNDGNIYIADAANMRIRKVSTSGTISTYAGDGENFAGLDTAGDYGPATAASITPYGLRFDHCGNLFIGSPLYSIRAIVPELPTPGNICGLKVTAVNPVAGTVGNGSLKLYPNPTNGTFTINVTGVVKEMIDVVVSDITGRIVLKTSGLTGSDIQLQLNASAGMYFVHAATQTASWDAKLIKQ